MNCRQAERWLLRSFDNRLTIEEEEKLREHLRTCFRCQHLEANYQLLLPLLKLDQKSEPLPFFPERLSRKIAAYGRPKPEIIWTPVLMRAATIALVGLIILTGLMIFFLPGKSQVPSQTEALVFQEENLFPEVQQILNEGQPEQRNLRLMFSALEARDIGGRYRP
ncbi:MAG: anti-sigma factor family protein [Candidatus Aminicenantales bacterium]